jgi:hypothetical protein
MVYTWIEKNNNCNPLTRQPCFALTVKNRVRIEAAKKLQGQSRISGLANRKVCHNTFTALKRWVKNLFDLLAGKWQIFGLGTRLKSC